MNNSPNDQDREQHIEPSTRKKKNNGVLPWLLAGLVLLGSGFAGGWFLGSARGGYQPYVPESAPQEQTSSSQGAESKPANWSKLNKVKDQIYRIYNGPIDENKLLEGSIKGMVNALGDPYSQFYNAQEYKELAEDNTGKFVGVGIQISVVENQIVVVSPIEGGPAKEAGIMAGDIITKIDGQVYTGQDLQEAVKHMRGEPGTSVKLGLRRGDKELDFDITRREITTKSVTYEMLKGNLGYVMLSQFTKDSDKEVKKALDDLKAKGAKGFILDLRGNPGGFLIESVNIASNFIPKNKVIVSTMDKYKNKKEDVSIGGDYIGFPLVVLIDKGSASASEVIAGAFKDYKVATLIGEKSYGKGIVQTIMDLPEGEGLKLTVAAYYSPNGTNIHKIGIQPDVAVTLPEGMTPQTYHKDKDTQLQKAMEVLQSKIK